MVAGGAYDAEGRQAREDSSGIPWAFASEIAKSLSGPEEVYVLDLCEADGKVRLVELNPFSGADLYGCDPDAVVRAVSEVVVTSRGCVA